jgi:hypothetical protein
MYMPSISEKLHRRSVFLLHSGGMAGIGDFVLTGERIWFIRVLEFSVWEFRRPCIF